MSYQIPSAARDLFFCSPSCPSRSLRFKIFLGALRPVPETPQRQPQSRPSIFIKCHTHSAKSQRRRRENPRGRTVMCLPTLRSHVKTPRLIPRREIWPDLLIARIQPAIHSSCAQLRQRVGVELLIMKRVHGGQSAAGELIIKGQLAPKAAVASSQNERREIPGQRQEMIKVHSQIWIRMISKTPSQCTVYARPTLRQLPRVF